MPTWTHVPHAASAATALAAGLLGTLLTCASVPAAAAPVDVARSQLKFGFSQMNVAGEGDFRKFGGDVVFDPARPQDGKVRLVIELAGADAGSSEANLVLGSAPFFDVARFPSATFVSDAIRSSAPGRYEARGTLTVKGRAAEVVVPFTARPDGAGQWLEGAVPVSRIALHVGEGEWADVATLADVVQVRFKLFVSR